LLKAIGSRFFAEISVPDFLLKHDVQYLVSDYSDFIC